MISLSQLLLAWLAETGVMNSCFGRLLNGLTGILLKLFPFSTYFGFSNIVSHFLYSAITPSGSKSKSSSSSSLERSKTLLIMVELLKFGTLMDCGVRLFSISRKEISLMVFYGSLALNFSYMLLRSSRKRVEI